MLVNLASSDEVTTILFSVSICQLGYGNLGSPVLIYHYTATKPAQNSQL